MKKSIARFFGIAGLMFGAFSALLWLSASRAGWEAIAPFDVLGVLPLLSNIGSLAAYAFAAIFAAAAISCWLMVLRLWIIDP